MHLILHNFFRSSASVRLRVALNLKGLDYEYVSYVLRNGEARTPEYLRKNPQGLVPSLELEGGIVLTQSMAIMEWLEEVRPEPALLPSAPLDRARVRAITHAICCDIHPINNLRVLEDLRARFGASDAVVADWFRHWVKATFVAVERMLADDTRTGDFCHGDRPGLADACLYAQVINNKRFDVDMAPYPVITRVFGACEQLDAFRRAAPMAQPDAA